MVTRQERALRNAVILLAVATLVLGGLLFWSLRAMALLKAETAEGEASDVAAAGGQPVTEQEWIEELQKKHGEEVLLNMLNHIVVGKEAAALGITVTDEEIEQELLRGISGYSSEEQYYQQMESELGLSRQELREETAYRLTLQAIATGGITVSEAEIDDYLKQNSERFMPRKQMQLSIIQTSTYNEAGTVMDRLEQGRILQSWPGRSRSTRKAASTAAVSERSRRRTRSGLRSCWRQQPGLRRGISQDRCRLTAGMR